jgi:hypothetical protein
MRLMPDRLWQKSTKLWQLAQYFKCKVSIKISAQLLVKFKLNAKENFCAKKCNNPHFVYQRSTIKLDTSSAP